MGGAYKMDGIQYVDRFSRLFGWAGTGCHPHLNGRQARIFWIPIPGDQRRRLFLRIEDISRREYVGVPIPKRIEIWEKDFDSDYSLLLAKSLLITAGMAIVFLNPATLFTKSILANKKSGSGKSD